MAEVTESWTIQGITVDAIEDASKIEYASPESIAQVVDIMRADDTKTAAEAIAEVGLEPVDPQAAQAASAEAVT